MTRYACPVPGCDRPRRGDQNICDACAGQLARDLSNIPSLEQQLNITLARQTSSIGGARSSETPLPFNESASDAAFVLRNTLAAWIDPINNSNYLWPRDTITGMARWLTARHTSLCGLPDADAAVDEIHAAVTKAERVIDRPAERWFAGPCQCDVDLYAVPGAATVTCRECGLRYDVAERRKWLLDACEDQLLYGALIAQALTTLGQPVTPERIRTWAARGRIIAHGVDQRGRPQYRVGDILDLFAGQRDKVAS